MAASEPLLRVDDIHTYYGDSYVLHGISLSLTPGSYFFCARAMPGVASANADADATSVRRLIFVMCFPPRPPRSPGIVPGV